MDDVRTLASWLLGYGQESSRVLKEGIRISRVYIDKVAYSTIEKVKDSFDEVPSDLKEGFMDWTSDIDSTISDAYGTFQNRSHFLANSVLKMYNSMTSEDANFRFHLILEKITPDFSPLFNVCPEDCPTCSETSSEMFCRVCCPDLFPDPISFTSLAKESSYSAMVTSWLQSSLRWTGLHTVYQSWLQPSAREQHNTAGKEVKALIRNFNWMQQFLRGEKISISLEEVGSIDKEDNINFLADEVCGYFEGKDVRRPEGRIMGGVEVKRTRQYPWQLSLATGFMGMFYQHRCGAALLSERWALTAAHCMHTLGSESLYVMGGFLDINSRETAQIRKVGTFFNHENFVPRLYEQDVSLLRLESPVVYTPSLLPICLPRPTYSNSQEYSTYLGSTAILTGWGRQWDDGPLSTQLEMVELPVISNTECMAWYNRSGSRQFIPDHTFMCAGWEDGNRDACSGDSGGPLVVTREDGRAEVIGLVSW